MEAAGLYIADMADLLPQTLLRLQDVSNVGQQLTARLGQLDAVPSSDHQLHPQPFLQLPQGVAHGRRRQMNDLGGLCQAVCGDNKIKNPIADIYHGSSFPTSPVILHKQAATIFVIL